MGTHTRPVVAAVVGAASLAVVALLVADVFGEDVYVADGSSRWDTRGGGAHALFVGELILGLAVAACCLLIATRGSAARRLWPVVVGLGVVQVLGFLVVLVAFNAN